MEIIDKSGYLKSAVRYIENNIVSGKSLERISKKAGIKEVLIKNLCLSLKKFSEKQFFTAIHEALEQSHSSLSGAVAEVSSAELSVEARNQRAFIFLTLSFNIIADDEKQDRLDLDIKIFSEDKILIS